MAAACRRESGRAGRAESSLAAGPPRIGPPFVRKTPMGEKRGKMAHRGPEREADEFGTVWRPTRSVRASAREKPKCRSCRLNPRPRLQKFAELFDTTITRCTAIRFPYNPGAAAAAVKCCSSARSLEERTWARGFVQWRWSIVLPASACFCEAGGHRQLATAREQQSAYSDRTLNDQWPTDSSILVTMSSMTSSIHERQELERMTRFLGLKVAQIIVQSRFGETMRTECKAKPCSADWFNLAINDLAEVSTITKHNLHEELMHSAIPLCVEISVKTAEGFNTALEMWSLGVLPERDDPIVRVSNTTAYSRMGALLRSLLMISRVTPAYAISRKQSRDSYVICYRIFMAEPRLHVLGDNHKHIRVGNVRTPMGTINLTVSYRTRMTFSTSRKDSPEALLMKSDHFQADSSPEHRRDQYKVGAFVVAKRMPVKRAETFFDVPFSALLSPPSRDTATQPTNASDANTQSSGEAAAEPKSPDEESRRSSSSIISANDDFIMVDLKSPFVTASTSCELGSFYRFCQNAPPLQSCAEEQTLEQQFGGDLTKQLESFEASLRDYDDLIDSLRKPK